MRAAKVLSFEEAIGWNRKQVWIQTRDMSVSLPAVYVLENTPWLRFRYEDENGPLMFYVKKAWYGKTWRCFDMFPEDEDLYPWEEADAG